MLKSLRSLYRTVVRMLGSQPASSRARTHLSWPLSAAWYRAVSPSWHIQKNIEVVQNNHNRGRTSLNLWTEKPSKYYCNVHVLDELQARTQFALLYNGNQNMFDTSSSGLATEHTLSQTIERMFTLIVYHIDFIPSIKALQQQLDGFQLVVPGS